MQNLKDFLDSKVEFYNSPNFITSDPISIPHLFSKKQDIEIAGFFASIFAWGNRTTIINKCKELLHLMDNAPHDFCLNHTTKELKKLTAFKHRTFNTDDLLYFLEFFKQHYKQSDTLETAFIKESSKKDETIENSLIGFKKYFFNTEHLKRTEKHISSPLQGSTCKRLNMFLRWMVRNDKKGVDFGIWKKISSSQLIIPIDVHVARIARHHQLLQRKQNDWQSALELTAELRKLDKADPVKYDFALFGIGVSEPRNY